MDAGRDVVAIDRPGAQDDTRLRMAGSKSEMEPQRSGQAEQAQREQQSGQAQRSQPPDMSDPGPAASEPEGGPRRLVTPALAAVLKSAAEEAGEPLALPKPNPSARRWPAPFEGMAQPAFQAPIFELPTEAELEQARIREAVWEDAGARVQSAITLLGQRAAVAGVEERVIATDGRPLPAFAAALRALLPMTEEAVDELLPWVVADLSAALEHAPVCGGWGELIKRGIELVLIPKPATRRAGNRRVTVVAGLPRRD